MSETTQFTETAFKIALKAVGVLVVGVVVAVFLTLLFQSLPALKTVGWGFFTKEHWDPVFQEFGAKPFIVGTLLTAGLALLISMPFSLSISILLGEYLKTGFFSQLIRSGVDLLAAIPSVIFGFWGLLVVVPMMRTLQVKLDVPPFGVGILTASIILAIMIIPYSAAIGRELIRVVPSDLKDAGEALGATRYEIVRRIILPYARSGLLAGFLLSLGRAIGETMAVTMVIGNAHRLPTSIFSPGSTLASAIANEFSEATDPTYLSSLVTLGLFLFIITVVINLLGRLIIRRFEIKI